MRSLISYAALLGLCLALVVGVGAFEALGKKAHAARPSSQKTNMTQVRAEIEGRAHSAQQKINVALINQSPLSIYSIVQSQTPLFGIRSIQRRTTDPRTEAGWEKLDPFCRAPACKWDIDGPGEIKSKDKAVFSWIPAFVAKGDRSGTPLGAGRYRLEIDYQTRRNGAWLSVLSNEFVIE